MSDLVFARDGARPGAVFYSPPTWPQAASIIACGARRSGQGRRVRPGRAYLAQGRLPPESRNCGPPRTVRRRSGSRTARSPRGDCATRPGSHETPVGLRSTPISSQLPTAVRRLWFKLRTCLAIPTPAINMPTDGLIPSVFDVATRPNPTCNNS